MDTNTGYIHSAEEMKAMRELPSKQSPQQNTEALLELQSRYKEMKVEPTKEQLLRNPARIGRNEKCPCGSGSKFKHCCLKHKRG